MKSGKDQVMIPNPEKLEKLQGFHGGLGAIALGVVSIFIAGSQLNFAQHVSLYLLTFAMIANAGMFMTCRQIAKKTFIRETSDKTFNAFSLLGIFSLYVGVASALFGYSMLLGAFFVAASIVTHGAHCWIMHAIDIEPGPSPKPIGHRANELPKPTDHEATANQKE